MDEVADRLHALPAGVVRAEALPGLVAELVGQAEAAGHDEGDRLVGQFADGRLARLAVDDVGGMGGAAAAPP